ncbi:MAG: phage portal protein, partial [Alphaproteobacteria bacterium]|nr:phage portal protein [Alphaproteobacteria bacterium]
AFIDHRVKNGKKYTRVETHRKHYSEVPLLDADGNMVLKDGLPVMKQGKQDGYLITNELFEKIDGETFTKSDLVSVFPELIPETLVPTATPLFVYIKTPSANNYDFESPLGISTFANAIDTIQALDIAFDGLNSEILLGKKRIIVPTSAIKKVTDTTTGKQVRYFDPSDEIYQALDIDDAEKLKIQDNSVELRVEEIKLAIQTLLDILSMQCGLSQGTLSYKDGEVKTATEVISENSKTFKTKQDYENELADGIVGLMEAIREVQKLGTSTEYSVMFSDSIIQDRDSNALYWQNRYASGTCTLEQALMGMDGLSEADAKKQASIILGLAPVNTEETNRDAE